MKKCNCGSYAINIDKNGKECDVCYYKNKISRALELLERLDWDNVEENVSVIIEILKETY